MYQRIKKRLFDILELVSEDDRVSQHYHRIIFTLIGLNTLTVVLETIPTLAASYQPLFTAFEFFLSRFSL